MSKPFASSSAEKGRPRQLSKSLRRFALSLSDRVYFLFSMYGLPLYSLSGALIFSVTSQATMILCWIFSSPAKVDFCSPKSHTAQHTACVVPASGSGSFANSFPLLSFAINMMFTFLGNGECLICSVAGQASGTGGLRVPCVDLYRYGQKHCHAHLFVSVRCNGVHNSRIQFFSVVVLVQYVPLKILRTKKHNCVFHRGLSLSCTASRAL